MESKLTVPAYCDSGIWFPRVASIDLEAGAVWSRVASTDAARAASATADGQLFAKYPEWIRPHFAGKTGTFLDAGCGYGRVAIPLLTANPDLRCVGIDASAVMLRRFRELAAEHGVGDRVDLYCGSLSALPFPDSHFDMALSCAVLLHLPKPQVRGVILELKRVLAARGTLVLAGAFPNSLNLEGMQNVRHNFGRNDNGPVRAYTRREVSGLLRSFSSVDVEAHQMLVLPRNLGPWPLPFAGLSRKVNQYCTQRFVGRFAHSAWLVNHHDVVAIK